MAGGAPSKAQIVSVQRMIAKHSHEVAALSKPAYAALEPLLDTARRELAQNLNRWLLEHPKDGAKRYTAQKYRSLLVSLHSSFATAKGLGVAMDDTLTEIRGKTGLLSVGHLVTEVAKMSSVFDHVDFSPRVNLAAVMATGEHYLIPLHRTSADRYAKGISDDIRTELAKGILLGETVQEMTGRLERHGGPKGHVALSGVKGEPRARVEYIAEGLFRRYRYWAKRIVRTEVTRSYGYQAMAGYRQVHHEMPDLVKRWDASIDRRTCVTCAMLDGVTVPLDSNFPDGSPTPPDHPNCRCRCGAFRPHWAKYMQWAEEFERELSAA